MPGFTFYLFLFPVHELQSQYRKLLKVKKAKPLGATAVTGGGGRGKGEKGRLRRNDGGKVRGKKEGGKERTLEESGRRKQRGKK